MYFGSLAKSFTVLGAAALGILFAARPLGAQMMDEQTAPAHGAMADHNKVVRCRRCS